VQQLITRVFLLMALLLAVLWVGAQPRRWIPALLRWWQPQLELRVVSGFSWRDAQLHIARLELRWLQHDLKLESLTLTLDWDWPVPVVRALAIRDLVYRSVGGNNVAGSVSSLPRFWEQDYWARLRPLAGEIERFSIGHGDTFLLSGALSWSAGLESADLDLAWSAQTLGLRWGSLAPAQWRLDWQLGGELLSVGSANLRWDDPWLSWQAETSVEYADWSAPIQSRGRSRLFDTLDTESTVALQLAEGDWTDYRWRDVQIEAELAGTPAQWLLQSAHLTAVHFSVDERVHGADLRLTLEEALLWPLQAPWQLPRAEFSFHVTNDDPAVSAHWQGQWYAGELSLVPVTALSGTVSATVLAQYGLQNLPEMSLTARLQKRSEETRLQGQLRVDRAPMPVDFVAAYASSRGLRASATLDGRTAAADAWTAPALGFVQPFLPILQTLQFQPQLKLRLCAATGAALQLDLSGQLTDVAFATDSVAASGATLGPFTARWQGQRLDVKAPWQVQALRAGVEMQALAGELLIEGESRHMQAFRADWLGGVVSIANWDWVEGGTVVLRGLDLGAAVSLLGRPEVTVTGVIDGELPARVEEGSVSIQAGRVYGTAPGVIRYRAGDGSAAITAQPLDTVYRVLANLHYDVLDAVVTYRPDGELALLTRIEGYNPDVARAQPIHLNLNVEQNVLSLLRSLRAADNVNSWLERRMAPPLR
jgi:hypothetical protein